MPFSLSEKRGIKAHQPRFNPGRPFEAINSAYLSGPTESHRSVRILSCHYVGIRVYARGLTLNQIVSSIKKPTTQRIESCFLSYFTYSSNVNRQGGIHSLIHADPGEGIVTSGPTRFLRSCLWLKLTCNFIVWNPVSLKLTLHLGWQGPGDRISQLSIDVTIRSVRKKHLPEVRE